MRSGITSLLAAVSFTAFSSFCFADQKIPFELVDFQQYHTYQQYLKKSAKHKAFAVPQFMEPGSAYGEGSSPEEAIQSAKKNCKEKYQWDCNIISIDGKITSEKTRNIPKEISEPAEIKSLNIDSQSDKVKKLFKNYYFKKAYQNAKANKAYATNNFGINAQGHLNAYITEEIAIERALFHCNRLAKKHKDPTQRQACYVVAVNDRLLSDNIENVLAQK